VIVHRPVTYSTHPNHPGPTPMNTNRHLLRCSLRLRLDSLLSSMTRWWRYRTLGKNLSYAYTLRDAALEKLAGVPSCLSEYSGAICSTDLVVPKC